MSDRFDQSADRRLEARIRAALDDRAEDIASRAASPESMAWRIAASPGIGGRSVVRSTTRTRAGLGLVGVLVVIVLLGALVLGVTAGRRPPVPLHLAVDLSIGAEPGVETIAEAVRMGVGSGAPGNGYTLDLPDAAVFSDVQNDDVDEGLAARIAENVVADPGAVALIGPYLSGIAKVQIPVTNAAGLLQCSPSNTDPNLTSGPTAAELRPRPDRPSYVRVTTTDDVLARQAAQLFLGELGQPKVYVVSELRPYPGDIPETFTVELERRGGQVLSRSELPATDADLRSLVADIAAAHPGAIYFDGYGPGASRLLRALDGVGLGQLPFVGLDPLLDGSRSVDGSFLALAGPLAAHSYAILPATVDVTLDAKFKTEFRSAYGTSPARYATAGLGCAQVITAALSRIRLPPTATASDWREALRAEVTSGATFSTVLGTLAFDRAGDVQPAGVSIYAYDGTSEDWTFRETIIGAPAS